MLKNSIINNTWTCDSCQLETNCEVNPYFHISIQGPVNIICPNSEIDLCDTCIDTITIQPIVDYIIIIDAIPKV